MLLSQPFVGAVSRTRGNLGGGEGFLSNGSVLRFYDRRSV